MSFKTVFNGVSIVPFRSVEVMKAITQQTQFRVMLFHPLGSKAYKPGSLSVLLEL